jgi:hypothetical protein
VILLKRKLSVNVESRTLKKIVTALKSFGDLNRIDEIIRFADIDLDAKVKFFFLSLNLNLIFILLVSGNSSTNFFHLLIDCSFHLNF